MRVRLALRVVGGGDWSITRIALSAGVQMCNIQLEDARQKLANAEKQHAALPLQLDQLALQQATKTDIIALKEKELAVLKQSHEYRLSVLMQSIQNYRKYLGLDFRVNQGNKAPNAHARRACLSVLPPVLCSHRVFIL